MRSDAAMALDGAGALPVRGTTAGHNGYPDLIFFLASDWRTHFSPEGRYQAFAAAVAESDSQVLCVNTPVCPLTTPWSNPRKWRAWFQAPGRLVALRSNLHLYTPFVPVHLFHAVRCGPLSRLHTGWVAGGVRRVIQALGFSARERVAWVDHPLAVVYYGAAEETVRVYEYRDKYTEMAGFYSRHKALTRRFHATALSQADLVFCTSLNLLQHASQAHPRVFLSRNAADVDVLARTQDASTPVAPSMTRLPHPIIGYLGTIHEHTDIELLAHVAEARPHWSIVMIGAEQWAASSPPSAFARFRRSANVTLLGWVDREELPTYCKAFDVCVLPYRTDSAFNDFVDPTKLHEYTAMGKPVVATDLPELGSYRHIIKIGRTPDDFVSAIEQWLVEDNAELTTRRLSLAAQNSWSSRADQVLSILRDTLTQRPAGARKAGG